MVLKKQREWLNYHTKRIGEKITPQLVKDRFKGDLGDLLTADLNTIPRKGAAIGTVLPGYITYQILPVIDQVYDVNSNPEILPQLERFAIAASTYVNPVMLPAVAMYAGLGWFAGKMIEIGMKNTHKSTSGTQAR